MNFKEQADDIADAIQQISAAMGVPLLATEIKDISRRLARYHSKELFSILMALHDKQFFPTGADLEQQVRRALGMEPSKGLSEDLVERNRKEAIASGQSPEKAEVGARVARGTLRLRAVQAPSDGSTNPPVYIVPEKIPLPETFDLSDIAIATSGDWGQSEESKKLLEDRLSMKLVRDPLTGLLDFDEEQDDLGFEDFPIPGLDEF